MTIRIPPPPADPEEVAGRARALAIVKEEVATLIAAGPLYAPIAVAARAVGAQLRASEVVPTTITRECGLCDHQRTRWILNDDDVAEFTAMGLVAVEYLCRNCGRARFYVCLTTRLGQNSDGTWDWNVLVEKVGQWPKFELSVPEHLAAALGDHAGLFYKALTSRHHGYGIGAVAYLRRIIEETTDTLLMLLREVLALEAGRETERERIDAAMKERVPFEQKVKLAGEVMPAHLRPGGVNPFGILHRLFSGGLHQLSEEESLKIADAAIESIGYLFTQLDVHVRERRAYVEKMKALQALQQGSGS